MPLHWSNNLACILIRISINKTSRCLLVNLLANLWLKLIFSRLNRRFFSESGTITVCVTSDLYVCVYAIFAQATVPGQVYGPLRHYPVSARMKYFERHLVWLNYLKQKRKCTHRKNWERCNGGPNVRNPNVVGSPGDGLFLEVGILKKKKDFSFTESLIKIYCRYIMGFRQKKKIIFNQRKISKSYK